MTLIDTSAVGALRLEAERELRDELGKKAREAIKRKLRDLDAARRVVLNIEREISDLEASIADGSFAGA